MKRAHLLAAFGSLALLATVLVGAAPSPSVGIINVQVLSGTGAALGGRPVELFVQGKKAPIRVLTSHTTANGVASISTTVTPTLETLAQANGGYLNFSLVVARAHHAPLTYSFTRYVGAGARAGTTGLAPTGQLAVGAEHSVTLEAGHAPRLGSVPAPSSGVLQEAAVPLGAVCDYVQGATTSKTQYMTIGELHNARASTATFTYGQTADSTVEVGYSTTGTSNWTSDGTAQVSNSVNVAQTYPVTSAQWYDQGYQLKSKFTFDRTEYIGENACAGRVYYLLSAVQWDSGWELGRDESSYDGYHSYPSADVSQWPPGTGVTKSTASAHTYTDAVTVFFANLSAVSGYSTYVKISWQFDSNAGFDQYLYGNDGSLSNASIIYAY